MIVRSFEEVWEIYFHKAHALLAMDIGLSIDHRYWPHRKYLAAGLESIGEHDNGQPRWNGKDNLTEAGAPLDYRARKQVDLRQAMSVINSAQYKSSFMAIMVSLHCDRLYNESDESAVLDFLAAQSRLREQYLRHLDLDAETVDQCYEFLRFCDDLSLALCQDEMSVQQEKDLKPIIGERKIRCGVREDGSFMLNPWLFYEDELIFPIEYYRTTKKVFADDEELKQDIVLEKPLRKMFVFRK
ncbi:hypothetical protein GCM10009119_38040 [Algoriphagus jejuensis]|uniref:DUF3891 family protein n=1 Tax=Algoriphagus jejuensis TaxID=419934 RepID=A0ABP3YH87_9BACT